MQNCIITKVFKDNKSKDGKALIAKNGKPYWKVAIKTDKTGDVWYSSIVFKEDDRIMKLETGQETTLILEENGDFKNFRIPTKLDYVEARVVRLEQAMKQVVTELKKVISTQSQGKTSTGDKIPDFSEVDEKPAPKSTDIDADEISFD